MISHIFITSSPDGLPHLTSGSQRLMSIDFPWLLIDNKARSSRVVWSGRALGSSTLIRVTAGFDIGTGLTYF